MKMLAEDIKNADFKNSYLLYGEELYLRDQYKGRLTAALVDPADTMNLSRFEGKAVDTTAVRDAAETLPFLSEHRVILIEDSGLFKKGGDTLAGYIPDIPDTTCLIFVESEVDKRSRLYKAVNKYGRAVEFVTQTEATLKKWVAGRIKREGHKITEKTLMMFLEYTGTDMVRISSELEKLFCYTYGKAEISSKDVADVCCAVSDSKIFAMIDRIAEKKQKDALDLYYGLLAAKEPPLRILYLLARQFDNLLHVKTLSYKGLGRNAIADRLKMRPFAAGRCLTQSKSFTTEELQRAVGECASTEEAVKTGAMDGGLGIEMLIISLSGTR